ncbi:hypothetical protein QYB49_003228 [Clostridium perfringens]|nr:hypothetical protein [Clostridium perfringens]MDU7550052.1 hypothetical protein [Clostridium perfringens]
MKNNIKSIITISLVLIFGIFFNTYNCSAKSLDATNEIPVTGKIIFGDTIENNVTNRNDIQGNFPINPSLNPDKNVINIPKTGDTGTFIYLLILILAILMLIWQYRKPNEFEKEELTNE